jgi:hypothetical protein
MEDSMTDLTPEDEALLERARAVGVPTAEDHARVKQRIFAQIGVGAAALASTSTAGAAATGGGIVIVVSKVALAVVLVAATVGTGIVMTRHGPQKATIRQAPEPASAVSGSAGPSGVTTNMTATSAVVTDPAAEPVAPPSTVSPPKAVEVPPPRPQRSATPAWTSTLPAEADLLRSADESFRAGSPALALAALDEHAARFPSGALVQEREAERVVVLCALGRTQDARTAAGAFLRSWPRSPLAARVRSSCGGT